MTDEQTATPPALPAADEGRPRRPRRRRELSDRWAYSIMALLIIGALAGIVVTSVGTLAAGWAIFARASRDVSEVL